jgi:hypothetical protein
MRFTALLFSFKLKNQISECKTFEKKKIIMIYIIYWISILFSLYQLAKSQTFWTAFGALSAFGCFIGLLLVYKQFRLSAWINAQDIFTDYPFEKDRTKILKKWDELIEHLKDPGKKVLPSIENSAAKNVCRKMDQLCHLADKKFIKKDELFKYWKVPIGKSWIIIENKHKIVTKEREKSKKHSDKWHAFNTLGKEAANMIRSEFGLDENFEINATKR